MEHIILLLCVREVDIPAPTRGLTRAISFHASRLGEPVKILNIKIGADFGRIDIFL